MLDYTERMNEVREERARVLEKIADAVQKQLEGAEGGHDWWHIYRVRALARTIAEKEGADIFLSEMAALVHDIGDYKFTGGDEEVGPRMIREILAESGVSEEDIGLVLRIVETISFKGAGVADEMDTLEGKVVQDADRLDALGAIGIGRTFSYGGFKGSPMHDPNVPPLLHGTKEEYRSRQSTTINHFYEKLLLLKDRMKTATGRAIAEDRHAYMVEFVARFNDEFEGKK